MSVAPLQDLDLDLTDDVDAARQVLLDQDEGEAGPRSGSRVLPCGCWEHPVLHQAEGDPGRPWATRWRCSLCRHLKS